MPAASSSSLTAAALVTAAMRSTAAAAFSSDCRRASATSAAGAEASIAQKAASRLPSVTGGASSYRVHANVSLPATFLGATGPIGGLRLRLRAPVEHAGKLASVTVGGKAWKDFDAKAETVDFTPTALASKALLADMRDVVAVWG